MGAALSATAAVVAEFVASDKGLGYLLLQYNGQLETPMVFAIVVLLSLIGLAVYYAVELIERLTIPGTSRSSATTGACDGLGGGTMKKSLWVLALSLCCAAGRRTRCRSE